MVKYETMSENSDAKGKNSYYNNILIIILIVVGGNGGAHPAEQAGHAGGVVPAPARRFHCRHLPAHHALHGWWFSPVAACSLAATCKLLRRHLEPHEWSCTTRGCVRMLFERTLQRAQLTQLSLLRKHAQEVVERNYDRVLQCTSRWWSL